MKQWRITEKSLYIHVQLILVNPPPLYLPVPLGSRVSDVYPCIPPNCSIHRNFTCVHMHTLTCTVHMHTLTCTVHMHTLTRTVHMHTLTCTVHIHMLICTVHMHTLTCTVHMHTLHVEYTLISTALFLLYRFWTRSFHQKIGLSRRR